MIWNLWAIFCLQSTFILRQPRVKKSTILTKTAHSIQSPMLSSMHFTPWLTLKKFLLSKDFNVCGTVTEKFCLWACRDIFFPSNKTKAIFAKYIIEGAFPYSVLRDTDSICLFFIFICKPEITPQMRNSGTYCLESSVKTRSYIDLTHLTSFRKFDLRNTSLNKKLGYYVVKNIDDLSNITTAVNPKEYLEEPEWKNK